MQLSAGQLYSPTAVGRVDEVSSAVMTDAEAAPQTTVGAAEVRHDRDHLCASCLDLNHQPVQQVLLDGRVEGKKQRHFPRSDDRPHHNLLQVVYRSDDLVAGGVVVADIANLEQIGTKWNVIINATDG